MPQQSVEAVTVHGLRGFHCPGFGTVQKLRHIFGGRNEHDQGNLALSGGRHRSAALACRQVWLEHLHCSAQELVVGSQVHGVHVAVVTEAHRGCGALSPDTVIPNSDGLFTTTPELPLYLAVADCGGVLLTAGEGQHRALAVVHAGWRGLVGGILDQALGCFAQAGFPAASVQAWIAPAIALDSYEVGPEVGEHAPDSARRTGQGDRWQVDIALWAEASLLELGLASAHIQRAGLDTGRDERLFSHRRQGEGAGRNGLFAVLGA